MLTSMDSVIDGSDDPEMVDKAIRASTMVTSNLDQMPLNNQVREDQANFFRPSHVFIVGDRRRYHRESGRETQRNGIGR